MAFHNDTQEHTAGLHFWGERRANTQASRNKYTKKKIKERWANQPWNS